MMRASGVCPKCESISIHADARMIDRGRNNRENDLKAVVYYNPDAFLFKGEHTFELSACVCGSCGLTELYARPAR